MSESSAILLPVARHSRAKNDHPRDFFRFLYVVCADARGMRDGKCSQLDILGNQRKICHRCFMAVLRHYAAGKKRYNHSRQCIMSVRNIHYNIGGLSGRVSFAQSPSAMIGALL